MTGFITRTGLIVLVVCVLVAAVALQISEHVPTHLIMFLAGRERAAEQDIYITHLERDLTLHLPHTVSSRLNIHISPQADWFIYNSGNVEACYTLVNLHTWESERIPLPQVDGIGCLYSRHWLADGSGMVFSAVTPLEQVETERFIYQYDFASDALTRLDEFPPDHMLSPSSIFNFELRAGQFIPNQDLTGTERITLDDDGFPRFQPQDMPTMEFTPSSNDSPITLSPDYEFFAAALRQARQMDLFMIPAWDGEAINLTDNQDVESVPLWSPDGRYISYLSRGARRTEMRIYNVETGEIDYVIYPGISTVILWNVAWIE